VQPFQFTLDVVDRFLEALDLLVDLRRGDVVMRDFQRRVRDELSPADRDAGRYADAVKGETHHNVSAKSEPLLLAALASCESRAKPDDSQ